MKFYYWPGACSLGIHVVLEEIGAPYEPKLVDFKRQEQYSPGFVAITPKSKVPALQLDDGAVLTEYGAIATYLARLHPQAKLLPSDPLAEARAVEAMDYIVATIHMGGFTRIARPGNFSADPASHEQVKQRGREIYAKGLDLMDAALEGKQWLAGDYSIADTALFYVANWSLRAEVPLPPNVARHFAAMQARPAVQRARAAEEQAT